MLRDLFGYSLKNQYKLDRPDEPARSEYFNAIIDYIRKAPNEFPEQENRKRRKLPELPEAPAEETPKGPSQADLKAQKKKDRQTLNLLKLHIQPVMEQLKMKYKKFRTPIIDDKDIAYLYDEQDPQTLTTDLNAEQQQQQQQQLFRPFELDKDDKGVPGLREVASNKFFYNLEIVTIEKRLSNGYYKRPKDFLADIKRLAKDSKTSGDYDRTLKANEMMANVEVDMTTLEQSQAALVAECEAVYERDQERERQRMQKVREAERRGEDVPKIAPNVPPPQASKTTTETSGPVVLGQDVPGVRPALLPVTPSRLHGPSPVSNPWSVTNGSHQTNGSTVPSRPYEDSEMVDSQQEFDQQGNQQQDPFSPSQPNTQGQTFTQESAHTRVAPGSQAEQYHNSASTTTSGQKTSDKSNRSSGPHSVNTQMSNGVRAGDHPDFSILPEARGGSQLPDTQEQQFSSQSQPTSQPDKTMAPPPNRRSSITALLNDPAGEASDGNDASGQPSCDEPKQPRLVVDQDSFNKFHEQLVKSSSGLSVEQLEQVNASMMDIIWRQRSDWNRLHVLYAVQGAFNDTIKDIEACQEVLGPSQPRD